MVFFTFRTRTAPVLASVDRFRYAHERAVAQEKTSANQRVHVFARGQCRVAAVLMARTHRPPIKLCIRTSAPNHQSEPYRRCCPRLLFPALPLAAWLALSLPSFIQSSAPACWLSCAEFACHSAHAHTHTHTHTPSPFLVVAYISFASLT